MIVIQQAVASPSKPSAAWFFGNQAVSPGGRLIPEIKEEGGVFYMVLKIPNVSPVYCCSGSIVFALGNTKGTRAMTRFVCVCVWRGWGGGGRERAGGGGGR